MSGEPHDPLSGEPNPSEDPSEGLRNPFRREADAFRVLLIALGGIGIAIGLALLSPVAGAIAGGILVIAAVWMTGAWLREWLGPR